MTRSVVVALALFLATGLAHQPATATLEAARPPGWVASGLNPMFPSTRVHTILADPNHPGRLYAGGYAAKVMSTKDDLEGFYRNFFVSDDGGVTWGLSIVGGWGAVEKLVIGPANPATIYASISSVGIFRTVDGGLSWTGLSGSGTDFLSRWTKDLLVDPLDASTLYAAAGPYGVFKTADGGITWQKLSVVDTFCDFGSLAISQRSPKTIYVDGGCGMFRTRDAGINWEKVQDIPMTVLDMVVNPEDDSVVYVAAGTGGLWRSLDGGSTWRRMGNAEKPSASIVTIDPREPSRVFAIGSLGRTDEFGVYWSQDGGETWSYLGDPQGGKSPNGVGLLTLHVVGDKLLVGGGGGIWQLSLPAPLLRDQRYFSQTGFRVDDDVIWDYFNKRGGLATFGYPTSRTFLFQGFTTQFFQRRIVQLDGNGRPRLLNLLDAGLLPYARINGATLPAIDGELVGGAPDPANAQPVLAFVRENVPDTFQDKPVGFYRAFLNTALVGSPDSRNDDPATLAGFALEMWGVPTSKPLVDPNNHNFIYQRFQRGIMLYDGRSTQGLLLADYLKAIITGDNLPADLEAPARTSPLYRQYDSSQPNWVRAPTLLPSTNLNQAFSGQ